MGGYVSQKNRTKTKEKNGLLEANIKLQKELEDAKRLIDNLNNQLKIKERLFLEVSSYCACQKKASGK